jgi:hypothetical protein
VEMVQLMELLHSGLDSLVELFMIDELSIFWAHRPEKNAADLHSEPPFVSGDNPNYL